MSKELVIVEKEQLSSMANAVRNSTGSSDRFNASELSNIVVETLGAGHEIVLQNKTVAPSTSTQTVVPDNGYDGLSQVVVNAMPTATQATPSISVSSSGLITASATQSAGYVSAGTKSATKQLTVQAAQTITPGTSDKTIASGRYLTGTQTIKGDANLIAENIKSGVSIFGVAGSLESGSNTDFGDFSQIYCSTITPTSTLSSFTLPSEVTGEIAFFAIGYAGTTPMENSNGLAQGFYQAFNYLDYSGQDIGTIYYSYGCTAGGSHSTGIITISGKTVKFGKNYYKPISGHKYTYIVGTVTKRFPIKSQGSGGSG